MQFSTYEYFNLLLRISAPSADKDGFCLVFLEPGSNMKEATGYPDYYLPVFPNKSRIVALK
jgi:hypothetical protein